MTTDPRALIVAGASALACALIAGGVLLADQPPKSRNVPVPPASQPGVPVPSCGEAAVR